MVGSRAQKALMPVGVKRVSWVERTKLSDAMKGEEIGVVCIVSATLSVVKGGSARSDKILPVYEPVDVLESVTHGVRVVQHNSAVLPIPQIA